MPLGRWDDPERDCDVDVIELRGIGTSDITRERDAAEAPRGGGKPA